LSRKKMLILIVVVTMVLLIAGCSGSKSNQDSTKPNTGTESIEDTSKSITKLENDANLVQQLEAEEGIEKVMVQVAEGEQGAVNVDIEINNEQKLSVDEVVEKYSKVIRGKYPNRTLDIIITEEGKLLKHVTLK